MTHLVIAVFGKIPLPGRGKSRLVPMLGEQGACVLARGFLMDAFAAAERFSCRSSAAMTFHYTPEAALAEIAAEIPARATAHPQIGGDLGARMQLAMTHAHARVLLIGTDSPTRPDHHLDLAAAELSRVDLVLSPARDGGYGLIGLSRPCPQIFTDMSWSTPGVTAETLRRAHLAGLSTALIPGWYDVDTPADLEFLLRELCGAPVMNGEIGSDPQHTRAALRSLGRL